MENDDKYLPQLLAEKDSLDSSFTHAMKLLNAGKEVFHCVVLCCVVQNAGRRVECEAGQHTGL